MDKDSQSSSQSHCSFPANATTSANQMGFLPAGADSGRTNFFPAARPCDYCNAADAVIFCHADSAFTCMACDAMLHRPGTACHGRVWVCEVCEQAPAVVNCKADAAALCAACDRDIHSANPLASRHDRTQVVPFYDSAGAGVMKSDSDTLLIDRATAYDDVFGERCFDGAGQVPVGNLDAKSLDFFFSDTDQVLDYQIYSDNLVPMQTIQKPPLTAEVTHRQPPEYPFEFDLSRSHVSVYSNSVSSSSMDAGLVPDGVSLSEVSYPFPRKLVPSHVGMDREARVLRYKEKRKNRNFEKTIRYASRKAYAEARPRIKGRFVKRPVESDGTFSLGGHGFYNDHDALFGVVPSS